ncbi:serine/threonine-protein phosphatase PP1-gamma catalytic subunit-like [Varroa jacobsoni]|uniref:Serine/threonine-protein phosphatase n=1 Tax=Varroa destructor TaxID=109461 RepID=A0A7M7KC13_VARDE|nr:serine/threonine-protein phosphatase PP1-gamma catalytic subunit-like [Varroa destructor]XP_022664620.1 serine/threonine-protein phosphatase PP1-gamma catalytic subunit-like [Varroa destructor]XP_022664624.1 serine/threonine-protein phosphatase PP1-gamma catalytic subunit-like [Varroa destructor]XP_022664633.1 serine/threonine-protein phosphatase PP1-gamma catalytic subunit-like [Varroa destructor]XP_022664642.1 serine/threonine-protein phosphatase PP1-gamma catalytic subunit-like [Varroa de
MYNVNLDNVLERLLKVRKTKALYVDLKMEEVQYVIDKAQEIISSQPMLIELDPPLHICGDTHGQFHDLLRILNHGKHPPMANYLFLGDYVDRGRNSIEVLCLLLIYKIKYPGNVFMLRGNHESVRINSMYGFLTECRHRYNLELYNKFNDLFAWFPLAGLVADKIFCCHGGPSPDIQTWDDIRSLPRPMLDVPDHGIACDLLWADPSPGSGWVQSDRGVSYLFGADALAGFLQQMGLDLVARAHQVVAEGYEFFADRQLVTIFSAPNYCNEFDNAAAMMTVTSDLTCSFRILRPVSRQTS